MAEDFSFFTAMRACNIVVKLGHKNFRCGTMFKILVNIGEQGARRIKNGEWDSRVQIN